MASGSNGLVTCDFEVFGTVQGVYFRKYTQKMANQLKLRGWCYNTKEGTVTGQLEGNAAAVGQMCEWLQKTGSPESRIEKAVISATKPIETYTFQDFEIRK